MASSSTPTPTVAAPAAAPAAAAAPPPPPQLPPLRASFSPAAFEDVIDPSALFEPDSPLATGGAPPGLRASVARTRIERAAGGGGGGGGAGMVRGGAAASTAEQQRSSPEASPFPSPPVSPSAFQGPVYSLSNLLEGNLQRGTRATRKAR